jgi:transketolase
MASEGYHVFTYSIANFPTFRCAEQIRNDVDYHNLPVTVVAVGGGVAYGNLGYSHHAVQDYALMRTMPNMLIASPGDPNEVRACLRYLIENPQPSYLRLGKNGEVNFSESIPIIKPGVPVVHGLNNVGFENVLLSTGAALQITPNYSNNAERICSLPLWGMKYKKAFCEFLDGVNNLTTIEDHLLDGGFGSWVLEASNQHCHSTVKVKPIHLDPDVSASVAKSETLLSKFLRK